MEGDSSTPLDALYNLLQEKKIMQVEDIAARFNVSKELAIEWGKILEMGSLATISNPKIGKPVIKIAGYTGEGAKKELSKDDLIKKKLEEQKEIIEMNKLIKNRNQEKIKEAKKIISESRKRGYDAEFIKKMFSEKKWPLQLIDDFLK